MMDGEWKCRERGREKKWEKKETGEGKKRWATINGGSITATTVGMAIVQELNGAIRSSAHALHVIGAKSRLLSLNLSMKRLGQLNGPLSVRPTPMDGPNDGDRLGTARIMADERGPIHFEEVQEGNMHSQ